MEKTQELFSYPIVVIESLWPKLPEEAPKLVGEKYLTQSDDKKAVNAYIYSETQNAFSGYFKIIPLNIKSINVNAGKDGHSFDIAFDPSYVYVQFDPRYVSKSVYNYIVQNSFEFTRTKEEQGKEFQNLNYLSGILEGFSKSQMEGNQFSEVEFEHYFVPGNIISKFVNEMDTVTIFLVQDLSIFDQDELIKLAGGGFSRRREVEVLPGTKKLLDLGIVKPTALDDIASVTLADKLQSLRSLLFNNSLGKYSYTYKELPTPQSFSYQLSTLIPTPYSPGTSDVNVNTGGIGNKSLLATQIQEISNIDVAIKRLKQNNNINLQLNSFGPIVGAFLYDRVAELNSTTEKIKLLQEIKNNIYQYYLGKIETTLYARVSNTLSWTLFKSLLIIFGKYINESIEGRDRILYRIIQAVAIDLYIQYNYPETYVNILQSLASDNSIKMSTNQLAYKLVAETIELLKDRFADAPQHYSVANSENINKDTRKANLFYGMSAESYFWGLETFFTYVIKSFIEDDENKTNKSSKKAQTTVDPQEINILKELNLEDNLQILEDLTNLRYPLSCETPYFVLNGHISKITDSSSVNANSYARGITISGTGFELPMKNHQIFIDVTNANSSVYKSIGQAMISNSTPIAAALSIMAMHLPDYAQFFEKLSKTQEFNKGIKDQRNFALYSSAIGVFVEKGTVLHKTPGVDKDFFILAPIHYIDKSYLKIIKSTFDSTLIATNQILTEQRTINNGSVYENIRAFVSNSSMYSFFIDEFGTMKLRFEPSAVTQTNSTILSPYVTDKNLLSLSTTTDQSPIQTLVEILPKPMSGGSGQSTSLLYSRATPPDIVDAYGLYKPIDLSGLLKEHSEEFYNFINILGFTFEDALNDIATHYNKVYSSGTKTTLKLPVVKEEVIAYDKVKESLKEIVLRKAYLTDQEKKEEAERRAKEKAEEEAAKAGTGTGTGTSSAATNQTPTNSEQLVEKAKSEPFDHCIGEEAPTTPPAASTNQNAEEKPSQKEEKKEPVIITAYEHFFVTSGFGGDISGDYRTILFDEYENFSSYIPRGSAIIPFTVDSMVFDKFEIINNKFLKEYDEASKVLGDRFSYRNYLRYRINQKLEITYASGFSNGGIFYLGKLAIESIDTLISIFSTLARLGILGGDDTLARIKNNINANISDAKTIKNYVSWMIRYTKLFYMPSRLSDLDAETKLKLNNGNFIVEEKESRRIPVNNFTIQDLNPRSISADLFRYGLRRMQQDDFYAQNSKLTNFRAETVRKLYEYPMRTASISILLNPMYKVGNTVLVASENLLNNKGTYINLGVKRMLESTKIVDSANKTDAEGYNLYIRVDDLVKRDGLTISNNKLYSLLTGISGELKESVVINHFKEAAEFLVGEKNNPKGLPVPSDAYVPLLGIYSNKNRNTKTAAAVTNYLKAVLKFHITTVDNANSRNYLQRFGPDGYPSIYSDVEDAIIEVYKAIFGESKESYSVDNFNLLSRLLQPQSYHVYQYHINNVVHSWSFGKTSTTNLSGTFGLPCIMAYVPTDNSYESEKHIIGHMVTRGPNYYFNDFGSPNVKLMQDLPEGVKKENKGNFSNESIAYKFSEGQLIQEEKYYKSKYRYNLEYILEKIRRKYTMPQLYGDIIFRKKKD